MNQTIIITGLLIISLLAPFISFYAISLIKKGKYKAHVKIQKRLFWVCVIAVILFEVQLRISGGSGSLVGTSKYADTTFFKFILIAHILGAVLTYLVWGVTIFVSNRKWKKYKTYLGKFSEIHRKLGYVVISGLIYTVTTALIVCTLAFIL